MPKPGLDDRKPRSISDFVGSMTQGEAALERSNDASIPVLSVSKKNSEQALIGLTEETEDRKNEKADTIKDYVEEVTSATTVNASNKNRKAAKRETVVAGKARTSFDMSKSTKRALTMLKLDLQDIGVRATESNIVEALIRSADIGKLKKLID